MRIGDLLKQSSGQLTNVSDSPRLDAEILLAHCLQKTRSYLYTWPEYSLDAAELTAYNTLLKQRTAGQPIAYLTGYREFWGLKLKVSSDTLIPRPDTELLVETVLGKLAETELHYPSRKILDLGTGSGAIAIALASELPKANITATEQSPNALAIAQENAQQHGLSNISFIESDWFSAIPPAERFDFIVSNPPYIATNAPHLTQGDVRFEPRTALTSGTDGLDDICHLIVHAKAFLATEGMLVLEHGYDQAEAIGLLLQHEDYTSIACLQDLAGNDRISYGHYPTS